MGSDDGVDFILCLPKGEGGGFGNVPMRPLNFLPSIDIFAE